MRSVSGDVIPSKGSVMIEGTETPGYSPKKAREIGVEMVYQDLALCDNMEIYENIFLGRELSRFSLLKLKIIDRKRMLEHARSVLDRIELNCLR